MSHSGWLLSTLLCPTEIRGLTHMIKKMNICKHRLEWRLNLDIKREKTDTKACLTMAKVCICVYT